MPVAPVPLDATDRSILAALQDNSRATLYQIGQAARLGISATRVRLRRLEEHGVITGYRAVIDPNAVGLPVRAVMRLAVHGALYDRADQIIAQLPQVTRCMRISGEACYLLEVYGASLPDIDRIEHHLATTGTVTTEIVYATVTDRPIPVDRNHPGAGAAERR